MAYNPIPRPGTHDRTHGRSKTRKFVRSLVWKRFRSFAGPGATAPCHWCGWLVEKRDFTLDHLVPVHKGGANELENLVVACRPCNAHRNTLDQIGLT